MCIVHFQISPVQRRPSGGLVSTVLPQDEPEQHGQPPWPPHLYQLDHDRHQPGFVITFTRGVR